jgi:chloramphenicol O-acetyltransferase
LERKNPDLFSEIQKEVEEKFSDYLEQLRKKRENYRNEQADKSKPGD